MLSSCICPSVFLSVRLIKTDVVPLSAFLMFIHLAFRIRSPSMSLIPGFDRPDHVLFPGNDQYCFEPGKIQRVPFRKIIIHARRMTDFELKTCNGNDT